MIAAHDDIRVGDVYVGHQAGHNDWVIKIVSVSLRAVRYELVSGPGGGKRSKGNQRGHWLLREIITRSFDRIQKGERPRMAVPTEEVQAVPMPTEEDGGYRTCKACGELKHTSSFDLAPTRNGAHHQLHTCHPCIVAHRAAGIRAAFARKRAAALAEKHGAAPEPDDTALDLDFSLPDPEPPAAPDGQGPRLLSLELLEFASRIEGLERQPLAYAELLTAAQGLLEVAESAMGVWVIDDVAFCVLRDVVAQAEG